MKTNTVVFWTEARMSHLQVVAHRLPQVHRTGGSGKMPKGTWLALALEKYQQRRGSRWHGLEKSGHSRHQWGFVHPLGLGASETLVWIS
jgi:hypothetical protein